MRTGSAERKTGETTVAVEIRLEGDKSRRIDTGIGFFDHMLDLMGKQGFFGLDVRCKGDLYVDAHHTVEDVGIVFGQALARALGDKAGIRRYGSCFLPMDETLVLAALDISGRPYLHFEAELPNVLCGQMEAQLAEEFFRAVSVHSGLTLHIRLFHGRNTHHILEAMFKGFGRALGDAAQLDPRVEGVPSTKGVL